MVYDVVVVGAGLAGLQCARLLGLSGLRVLLVERKASLVDRIQTTGIFVRKTWEDFPLPEEQLGKPIRRVTLYSPKGRSLRLNASRDEFRVGRMSWIYVQMLEQCCRAGVRWLPERQLVSCEPIPTGTLLTLEHKRRRERFATRYVVGADGPQSMVARQLGLDRNDEFLTGIEDIVPDTKGGEPSLHCFLDPCLAPGYIAWVVNDGEEAHVGVAGYRARFQPVDALRQFRARVGILAGGRTIERRGGLIPVNGILRRIANTRALLVGDAAGAVSPLTAGGLDAAMRLSSFAADVIARHLDGGDSAVLAEYSGAHFRPRFVARRWMRHALRAAQHPLLLEAACAVLRTGPFRALAAHIFFGRGSFPDIPPPLRDLATATQS